MWRYVGASVAGVSHRASGAPCQDSSLVHSYGNGDVLIAIVSDGAGSARHADIGSQLVCHTILEEAHSYIDGGGRVGALTQATIDAWIAVTVHKLAIQAKAMDVQSRDLAATLVAAVLAQDGSAFIQIGDGAVVVRQNDRYSPMTWPENGDYANVTYFITDDRALDHLQSRLTLDSYDEVAVVTDGLQPLVLNYQERTAHSPFFEPLFSRLRSEPPGDSLVLAPLLQEYLASPAINSRTDDDKSIILATRLTAQVFSPKDDNITLDLGNDAEVAEMTSDRLEM